MAVAMLSCKKESNSPDITKTIVLPANGSSVIQASNKFAFNFLNATIQQDNSNNNKLISPLSIYLALSTVYNGTDNATKDSIAKTLQLSGIDINDLNAICKSIITQLPDEDSRVQFSIANSIWYNQNIQPLNTFLQTGKSYYNALIQSLDFNDLSSVNTINNWAAQNTNNKIKSIISNISSDDLMYLINAIYFNGKWQYAFASSNTHNADFYLQDGSSKSVPFMTQDATFNFYTDSLLSLIELPYGSGNSYSMYIALPKNHQQLVNTFSALMNEKTLSDAISKMSKLNVHLNIPEWEYGYALNDMKPELATLGMGLAFNKSADFSNMYNPDQVKPYITQAIHKTYIKVNEEGTEAAAVTAIGIGTTAILNPYFFTADHPFLYTIIEKQTGAVLFTGIVNDPSLN